MIRNKVVWDKHYYSNIFTVRNIFLLCYSRFRLIHVCIFNKQKNPGSNHTVGKNFTFCNSRSTRDTHSSSKPMRMKSTMTYT